MSKRPPSPTPSPPPKLRRSSTPPSAASSSSHPLVCSLPPTCTRHPALLPDAQALERHYRTYHAHVCQERACLAVFPDERLLELHFAECHDPIVAIRKERGEKTFRCFVPTCSRMFLTPALRRLHLIDAHRYPKEYFFAVTNKGVAGLLEKWGEGVSLVRPGWKARPGQEQGKGEGDEMQEGQEAEAGPSGSGVRLTPPNDPTGGGEQPPNGLGLSFPQTDMRGVEGAGASSSQGKTSEPAPLGWTFGTHRPPPQLVPRQTRKPTSARTHSPPQPQQPKPSTASTARGTIGDAPGQQPPAVSSDDAAITDLAAQLSAVSLVPRSIRFGRGGARAGFERPPGWRRPAPEPPARGAGGMAVDQGS